MDIPFGKAFVILVIIFMLFGYFMTSLTKTIDNEKQKLEIEKIKLEIELKKLQLNDSTNTKQYDNNNSIDRTK